VLLEVLLGRGGELDGGELEPGKQQCISVWIILGPVRPGEGRAGLPPVLEAGDDGADEAALEGVVRPGHVSSAAVVTGGAWDGLWGGRGGKG